jgi:hypothetical protein
MEWRGGWTPMRPKCFYNAEIVNAPLCALAAIIRKQRTVAEKEVRTLILPLV